MSEASGILLTNDQLVLVTTLIKIGLMAAMATVLSRFDTFNQMFFWKRGHTQSRIYFIALMGGVFSLGVATRIILGYRATDMGFEGALLSGLIAGPVVGLSVGVLVSLPALAVSEFAALPVIGIAGIVGGVLHHICYREGQRISFSPLTLIFARRYRVDHLARPHIRNDLLLLVVILLLVLLEITARRMLGSAMLYALVPNHWLTLAALLVGEAMSIGVPLMIWDHTYVEQALDDRERSLTQARLEGLKSRIQPHFLFNTLNTISSLIRVEPAKARLVVQKLAQILRTVLDLKDDVRPLSEEIEFVESFLTIERARFGDDSIRLVKEVPENISSFLVPSLLLQPIVENSVVHGLRKRGGNGTIRISAKDDGDSVEVIVEDDGAGIPPERLKSVKTCGVGLSNVEQRLNALYGSQYEFHVESEQGKGTRIVLKMPKHVSTMRLVANQ